MTQIKNTMSKRDILTKVVSSVLTLTFLTALLLFIFRNNMADIVNAFKKLSFINIIYLIALGSTYQLIDSMICYYLVKDMYPHFKFRQALGMIYLGVFGKSSAFAGTIPMKVFYLHYCCIEVGHGIGVITEIYILHKVSVVLFASIMLFTEKSYFPTSIPGIHKYLIAGYIICTIIICVLILLCTWRRAHNFALWLLNKLPKHGKWKSFTQRITTQLDCLYGETTALLKNRKLLLHSIVFNLIKLAIFCAIPYVCLKILGTGIISFPQSELLTALMFLIVGAVPNIAGIGPTEVVFFLIYAPLLGDALASSSLLMFRITTHYLPFIISALVFIIIQLRLLSYKKKK